MTSKWAKKRTELVTAVARNLGPHGVNWEGVAKEMGETAKSCESAWWRLDKDDNGQATIDARLLKAKIRGNKTYAQLLPSFPGMTVDDLKNRMKVLSGMGDNGWIDGLRIGHLDIESSDLKANIGIMLSWSIKVEGEDEVLHDWITREEAIDWDKRDKRIVGSLLDALDKIDLIFTYNGAVFDVPFIRTRALYWGYKDPLAYGDLFHKDAYYTAKSKLSLYSKRLAVVTQFLDIDGKTSLPPEVWNRAQLGYEDAMEYVVDHCDEDVIILEELVEILKPYMKITRKSV